MIVMHIHNDISHDSGMSVFLRTRIAPSPIQRGVALHELLRRRKMPRFRLSMGQ